MLTKLAYAHTHEEYDELRAQLLSSSTRNVCTNFEKNRHPHLEEPNATGKIAAEIKFLSLIEDELFDAKDKHVEQAVPFVN